MARIAREALEEGVEGHQHILVLIVPPSLYGLQTWVLAAGFLFGPNRMNPASRRQINLVKSVALGELFEGAPCRRSGLCPVSAKKRVWNTYPTGVEGFQSSVIIVSLF
jgi:hypothetical protein